MNRKLILQGSAGEALGEEWNVYAPTIGDAFAVVRANCPKEFLEYFGQDEGQGEFSVKLAGEALDENELGLSNLKGDDIVVTPVPKGSKLNAVEKIILAVVLIVASFYMPGSTLDDPTKFQVFFAQGTAMLGINLALAGINELMMKEPSKDKEEEGAMFGGPANTIKNGLPVPMAYGKILVGGAPINFGFGAWKLEPTNGFVFASDSPNSWDGILYQSGSNSGSTSDTNDGSGTQDGAAGDTQSESGQQTSEGVAD
jgi:predicted phage tail protein